MQLQRDLIITIVQNQMINEYPGLIDDPEATAEVMKRLKQKSYIKS